MSVLGEDAFRSRELGERITLVTAQWSEIVASLHSTTAGSLVRTTCGGEISKRGLLLMRVLGVSEDWQIGSLSEGQLRRVQLAVKLAIPSDVLLLDEATTDLDLVVRRNCKFVGKKIRT